MGRLRLDFKREIDFYIGGLLVFLLYFPVRFLGVLLKRPHHLTPVKNITIIKLLGGGSLLLALPALLAIKKKHPQCRFCLVCSQGIRLTAEALNFFDEIKVVDDRSVWSLAKTAWQTWIWMIRTSETVIDLEVHSKLTTIFSTASMARNRLGFYDKSSEWRKRIYTHSIYFNVFNAVYEFYDSLAVLFECQKVSVIEANKYLKNLLNADPTDWKGALVLGVGCSDLSLERQWSARDWIEFLKLVQQQWPELTIVFLGGAGDRAFSEQVVESLPRSINLSGRLKLLDSITILSQARIFMGIDSMLLHFARLLQVPSLSVWGPTRPHILLRPGLTPEYTSYSKISCSPCVHITEKPPCLGENICMRSHTKNHLFKALEKLMQENSEPKIHYTQSGIWVVGPSFSTHRCEIEVEQDFFKEVVID